MTKLNPLSWNSPIVDAGGRPTPDFMRKWQQQQRINDFPSISLPSSQILVGDAAGVAAPVPMSGDAAISNTGAVTVSKSGGVAFGSAAFQPTTAFDAAGAATAAQAAAKSYTDGAVAPLLPKALTSANLFVGNASGVAAGVAMSGDAVINNAGVITVSKTGGVPIGTAATVNYTPFTWSPFIQFGSAGGGASTGQTYSLQTGVGIRIGKLVMGMFTVQLSNKGTSTGLATLTLPYLSGTVSLFNNGFGNISFWANMASLVGLPYSYIAGNSSVVQLTDSGVAGVPLLSDTNFTNTSRLDGGFCYVSS